MTFGEAIYYCRHFKRSRMYVFIERKGSKVSQIVCNYKELRGEYYLAVC